MAPTIVGTPIRTSYATTRSPTTGNVASAGVLQADDWVISFVRSDNSAAAMTLPSEWNNAISFPSGTTIVAGDNHSAAMIAHKVTASDVSGGVRSWTLTNLWASAHTGATYSVVVRGADPTNPFDAFGSTFNTGSNTATHVLAGMIAGDITNSSDLILSGVCGDSTQTYATAPTGWTFQVKNSAATNTGAVLTKDTGTTAGVAVTAENITASSASRYVSITLAIQAVQTTDTTKFFFAQL